jgi:hypothetical protein
MRASADHRLTLRATSAGFGLTGATVLIGAVVSTVQALAQIMGTAAPMVPVAAIVVAFAAAVAALSLLTLRGHSWTWIPHAVAGGVLVLLGLGEYHMPVLSWLLFGVGTAWFVAAGFGFAARRGRSPIDAHPIAPPAADNG